jgi:peptidoglycan-associated lipoprotein
MNVRTLATLGTSALIAGLLTACGSNVKLDDTPVENRTPAPVSSATPQSQVQSVTAPGASGSSLLANQYGRIVYFDFDSYVVRDEYRPMVTSYAKYLGTNAQQKLTIEGHTDERGGSEYNLALGQKRAEAVRKSELLGARTARWKPSYGKERPSRQGSTKARAKNRRAD